MLIWRRPQGLVFRYGGNITTDGFVDNFLDKLSDKTRTLQVADILALGTSVKHAVNTVTRRAVYLQKDTGNVR